MSLFWSIVISVIVLGNILGYTYLLLRMRKMPKDDVASGAKRDHVFDGIEEYNNPLPRWWMWLFLLCNLFALVYLTLYPGLGNYKGTLGWTQANQWEAQNQEADKQYAPIFAKLAEGTIPELVKNPEAMQVGKRIFMNNCSMCHGLNAQGAIGFPNLTTNDWLYGGDPETLKKTISDGRNGYMPPMAGALGGDDGVREVANYVLMLSGKPFDEPAAQRGESKFKMACAACHGQDGKGNKLLGARDLTSGNFVMGTTLKDVISTIKNGRQAHMPAHKEILGEDKVHLVAAYIYSLSHKE